MQEAAPLRRGWTTGACATAATKSAVKALLSGAFHDPVTIILPKGEKPSFPLALEECSTDFARAGIIKDAGDDPDVTHGAMIIARVARGPQGSGIVFRGGEGVGTVTKPGLPVAVGEPAINPVPRQMMEAVVREECALAGVSTDIIIEISVPGGEALALKTWNPRLGIVGGLSILGTTGVVHPFSCAAWIHSIHRGIDVARAEGLGHVAGSTGSTSEAAVQKRFSLPDHALLDMGDFAGGMLKYLRHNPVRRVTIGGGFAKITKLAQGFLDLHSGRSQVDFEWLAARVLAMSDGTGDTTGDVNGDVKGAQELAAQIRAANTAQDARERALAGGFDLAPVVAREAAVTARRVLKGAAIVVDVIIVDRSGAIIAEVLGDG